MRTTSRAWARLFLIGGMVLAWVPVAAAAPPEKALPNSTVAFAKIPNAAALREALKRSQMGRMLADPAMAPALDDFKARMQEPSQRLRQRLGVSLRELWELPEGEVSLAVLSVDDPKIPFAVLLSADAGKNAAAMQAVMTKATQESRQAGDKVATESFKGMTLTVIESSRPQQGDMPRPILAWTNVGSVYHVAMAATVEPFKDVLSNLNGRADSLADTESFATLSAKLGSGGQMTWYVEMGQVFKVLAEAAARQGIDKEQISAQLQLLGLTGLKAIGGTYALNAGDFDTVTRTYILAPVPLQGLMRMFKFPKSRLSPEPWVPATVASYQTINWDADNAYTAIDDFANLLVPGLLQNLEQNIGGPGGNLSFRRDLFAPMANRITVISDFKKPITESSQRTLLALALDDAKAFQTTFNKILALAEANPRKREFQGTTIYDFDLPELPNAPAGAAPQGPVSVAIAQESLFVATDPTLLEQVLRPGGPSLAENPMFRSVAKEYPAEASSISFQKPEEQARIVYDMLKSGQLEQAMAAANAGVDAPQIKISDYFDVSKLPDFSVLAKYFLQGGGYGVTDDQGMSFMQFTLRPVNP
jgi:hypothetical protein